MKVEKIITQQHDVFKDTNALMICKHFKMRIFFFQPLALCVI